MTLFSRGGGGVHTQRLISDKQQKTCLIWDWFFLVWNLEDLDMFSRGEGGVVITIIILICLLTNISATSALCRYHSAVCDWLSRDYSILYLLEIFYNHTDFRSFLIWNNNSFTFVLFEILGRVRGCSSFSFSLYQNGSEAWVWANFLTFDTWQAHF